ncbi:MAG: hypothetical protein ABIO37_10450 [Caulobacteraceae bacterium]
MLASNGDPPNNINPEEIEFLKYAVGELIGGDSSRGPLLDRFLRRTPQARGPRVDKPFISLPVADHPPLPDQTQLKGLVGHYLLIRRFNNAPAGLMVSHMSVTVDESDKLPLRFRTSGRPNVVGRHEPKLVIGKIFTPHRPALPTHLEELDIYALGCGAETNEIRSSIMRRRERYDSPRVGGRFDLAGIRLSIGASNNVPRAYKVWGCHVDWDAKTDAELERLREKYVKFYPFDTDKPTGETFTALRRQVPHLDDVAKWLNAPSLEL